MKTAIVSVAYNRTASLRRQLDSLERACYPEPVTLIVSIDKSPTDDVVRMVEQYQWPHGELRMVRHEHNLGLRAHMLSLGEHFSEFDALIVLEDDVTVAPSFYLYAQACIQKYYADERIAGISLYSFRTNYQNRLPFAPVRWNNADVYLMNCAQSWGQVWMKPQWMAFKQWYDGQHDDFAHDHLPHCLSQWPRSSWLKYHTRYCIEQDRSFVYPYYSLSTNNADPGENHHGHNDTLFQAEMLGGIQTAFSLPDVDEITVGYDGFFQPKFLAGHIGVPDGQLCVDLFSQKPASLYRRYVLSNRRLPYGVVRSFALKHRPVELNIVFRQEGSGLWLYDTTVAAALPRRPDRYLAYAYFFKEGFYKARTMIGPLRSLQLLWGLVASKIKKSS